MDIHELAERSGISLRKLRQLDKLGVLKLEPESEILGKIRFYVGKGRSIPAVELLHLVENPDEIFDLGERAGDAQAQVDALEISDDSAAAPLDVSGSIDLASNNNAAAVDRLEQWAKATIPGREVPYSFLAVRILLGTSPRLRPYNARRIARALLNVRQRESFADWFTIREIRGRRVTFYKRPETLPFDI